MALNIDRAIEAFIGIIVFVAITVTFIPMLLSWFTNLSGSGLVLASLFASVLPIILAVMIFKKIFKGLSF